MYLIQFTGSIEVEGDSPEKAKEAGVKKLEKLEKDGVKIKDPELVQKESGFIIK